MADQVLSDLAGRLNSIMARVARLETLEHGTTAFPTGGTGTICDIKLAAPAASVVCPVIPAGFRHLLCMISAGANTGSFFATTAGKIRVTVSGIVAPTYGYYTRQEHHWLGLAPRSTDSEADGTGGGVPYWETVQASVEHFVVAFFDVGNAMMLVIGDPDNSSGKAGAAGAWIGAAQYFAQGFPDPFYFQELDLGGGWTDTVTAVTSITFTCFPPFSFLAGSRFTVYGM